MPRTVADTGRTRSLGLLSFALFLSMPVVLAVAVALSEWRIAVALVPLFAADWFVDRAWARSGGGDAREVELTAHEEDELERVGDGVTDSLAYILEHPELVARARFTYRFALRAHVLLRPVHWAGFVLALVALPQHRLLAAVGVFVALAADNSGARKLAALALPRLKQRADDDERRRWLGAYERIEYAGAVALAAAVAAKYVLGGY